MIADRVAAVRDRVARAAARAGRSPEDVVLVAVCKTHPPELVREAFAAGLRDFGENRVQEAEGKISALSELRSEIRWHLVGHLQSNKARKAAALFDLLHSLDDVELGGRLDRVGGEEARVVRSFLQVDLAGEATKSGLPEASLLPTLEALRGLEYLRVEGLMILPPFAEDPEQSRPFFRRLRKLRDDASTRSLLKGTSLSMGMSHDFEVAIEEGATHIRVGTALFGARPPA